MPSTPRPATFTTGFHSARDVLSPRHRATTSPKRSRRGQARWAPAILIYPGRRTAAWDRVLLDDGRAPAEFTREGFGGEPELFRLIGWCDETLEYTLVTDPE